MWERALFASVKNRSWRKMDINKKKEVKEVRMKEE